MKKKLLNSMRVLLVAVLLGVGASAWGDTTVTHDFTSFSAQSLTKSDNVAVTNSSITYYYPTTLVTETGSRFAFRYQNNVPWTIDNGMKLNTTSKDDNFVMMNVKAGDVVTITLSSGSIFVPYANQISGNYYSETATINGAKSSGDVSQWGVIISGEPYTVKANGNLYLQGKRKGWTTTTTNTNLNSSDVDYCVISSITVVTSTTETVSTPTISSESADGGRNVTINHGVSNISSGVTTYYTTNGSTPTASSTKYTGPFLQASSATIKAITISSSSATTASEVASQEIDLETIDVPTASITKVDGVNRRVSFACMTEGVTFSYSTDNGDSFTEANYVDISSTTDIIVKATKGGKSAQSAVLNFVAGTEVELNGVSWNKTTYNAGTATSTVILTSNQTSVLLSPTPTIHYELSNGTNGDIASGASVSVPDGVTFTFYAKAEGYKNSVSTELTATAPNSDPQLWNEPYASGSDQTITRDSQYGESTYYYMQANSTRISSRLLTSSDKSDGDNWLYRTGGIYAGKSKGYAISGVNTGDYIEITFGAGTESPVPVSSDGTKDEWNSTSTKYAYTVTSTNGFFYFTFARYGYIKNILVRRTLATPGATVNGTYGYATFAADVALDLSTLTDGFTAFVATNVATGSVTMTSTTDKVPAGTGLFIKGSGDFTITETRDDTTEPATNYLVGVTEDGTVTASTTGTYHYVYAVQDGVATFYNVASDAAITAGKAYLETTTDIKPASGGARVAIIFDEESTGISTMHNSQCIMNNEVYDLQGRRVNTMLGNSEKEKVNIGSLKRGLYIVNGKKIIK